MCFERKPILCLFVVRMLQLTDKNEGKIRKMILLRREKEEKERRERERERERAMLYMYMSCIYSSSVSELLYV